MLWSWKRLRSGCDVSLSVVMLVMGRFVDLKWWKVFLKSCNICGS